MAAEEESCAQHVEDLRRMDVPTFLLEQHRGLIEGEERICKATAERNRRKTEALRRLDLNDRVLLLLGDDQSSEAADVRAELEAEQRAIRRALFDAGLREAEILLNLSDPQAIEEENRRLRENVLGKARPKGPDSRDPVR